MPKLIMVIEDTPDILQILGTMLKRQGYQVNLQTTWRGESSLTLIQNTQPDLIITDLMLGDNVDGLEIVAQLQLDSRTSQIPLIVCTAAAKAKTILSENPQTQHIPVIIKPFSYQTLLGAVKKVFNE